MVRGLIGKRVFKDVTLPNGKIAGLTKAGYNEYMKEGSYSYGNFVGYKKKNIIRGEKPYYK